MSMKVGDIVHLKDGGTYWKGVIVDIRDRFNDEIIYPEPIAYINGVGESSAVVMESNLVYKDGEWWETKLY